MTEPTYGDGTLGADDVIPSADYTGFLSQSEYITGDNGLDPEFGDSGEIE